MSVVLNNFNCKPLNNKTIIDDYHINKPSKMPNLIFKIKNIILIQESKALSNKNKDRKKILYMMI